MNGSGHPIDDKYASTRTALKELPLGGLLLDRCPSSGNGLIKMVSWKMYQNGEQELHHLTGHRLRRHRNGNYRTEVTPPPTALQKAIDAHCRSCIYDSLAAGNWRQQVALCGVISCELFEERPRPIRPIPDLILSYYGAKKGEFHG